MHENNHYNHFHFPKVSYKHWKYLVIISHGKLCPKLASGCQSKWQVLSQSFMVWIIIWEAFKIVLPSDSGCCPERQRAGRSTHHRLSQSSRESLPGGKNVVVGLLHIKMVVFFGGGHLLTIYSQFMRANFTADDN